MKGNSISHLNIIRLIAQSGLTDESLGFLVTFLYKKRNSRTHAIVA